MNAAEYGCDFWNNLSSYPYQQFNLGGQTNFNRQTSLADNVGYRNNQQVFSEQNQCRFLNYEDHLPVKTEAPFEPYRSEVNDIVHSTTPPLSSCLGYEYVDRSTCRQVNFSGRGPAPDSYGYDPPATSSTQSKTDDSPALRALLSRPPKNKISDYQDNSKPRDEVEKCLDVPFDLKCKVGELNASTNDESRCNTETDAQASATSVVQNYYPWMKSHGNLMSLSYRSFSL